MKYMIGNALYIISVYTRPSSSDITNKDDAAKTISVQEKGAHDSRRQNSRRGHWNRNNSSKMPNAKSGSSENLPSSNMAMSNCDATNECSHKHEELSNTSHTFKSIDTTKNAQQDILSTTNNNSNSNRFNVKCEIDIEDQFIEASINVTLSRYNKLINVTDGKHLEAACKIILFTVASLHLRKQLQIVPVTFHLFNER